ncbi:MAG: hypothetical protein WBC44_10945, partial [Planctomycetaceae bacterium]
MNWLWMVVAVVSLPAAVLCLYGLHRLCLRLEEQGRLYYWHQRSQTGASRMWTPLQEMIEPQTGHIVEAEEHHRADLDDEEADPKERPSWKRPA